jgi:hypothetical protein
VPRLDEWQKRRNSIGRSRVMDLEEFSNFANLQFPILNESSSWGGNSRNRGSPNPENHNRNNPLALGNFGIVGESDIMKLCTDSLWKSGKRRPIAKTHCDNQINIKRKRSMRIRSKIWARLRVHSFVQTMNTFQASFLGNQIHSMIDLICHLTILMASKMNCEGRRLRPARRQWAERQSLQTHSSTFETQLEAIHLHLSLTDEILRAVFLKRLLFRQRSTKHFW